MLFAELIIAALVMFQSVSKRILRPGGFSLERGLSMYRPAASPA